MGGLCCRQKNEDATDGSISHQVSYVPGRIHLHPSSAPSIEEETSNGLGNRTDSCRSALLCAAIDFGTAYTGYAFSWKNDHKRVFTMTTDEGSSKVPTMVLFDQNKKFHSFGYEAQNKYEKLLRQDNHREWYLFTDFKMTLFQSKELKENTPVKDIQERIEMPAIDVFANAIGFIKKKLQEDLDKRDSGIHESDIHWVLTVPAIWNDSAKQFMRNAAIKAGILDGMLSLALEPEAASVYCIESFPCVGKVGTRYIILDLNGGTADITCHKVVESGLKELKGPEGGRFGGTNVDKKFIKLLEYIFGSTP